MLRACTHGERPGIFKRAASAAALIHTHPEPHRSAEAALPPTLNSVKGGNSHLFTV